jgi:uncharacterized membrane protein YfcA
MLGALNFSAAQVGLAVLIVFAALTVRGMSGFGAGIIAIPLLVFIMPIHTAVPVMGLLVFVLFIFLTVRDRRDVVWDELKLLVPTTILGVIAGAVLFKNLDNVLLLRLLGALIISFAAYVLAIQHFGLPKIRCSRKWALPAGFVGAAIDTMFGGGGGTLVVIYMHLRGIGKTQFRATVATLWFFEMIARLAGYTLSGFYTLSTLLLAAIMLPVVWAGTYVGEHIGNRISQDTFSKVLAVVLLLSGVSVLVK